MTRHLFRLVWNRRRAHLLVGLEILVSFLIVFVVAVLALKTFGNAREPVGFSPANVTVVGVGLKRDVVEKAGGDDRARMERALAAVRRLDGVEVAAAAFLVPYQQGSAVNSHSVNGRRIEYGYTEATDEYLDAMGLQIVAGRWFSREDDSRPYRAMVVTRELARQAFGDEDPVGKDIPEGEASRTPGEPAPRGKRVVGVLAAYREGSDYSTAGPFAIFRTDLSSPEDPVPSRIVLRLRPGTPRAFEETLVRTLEATVAEWSFTAEPLEVAREAAARRWLVPMFSGAIVGGFLMLLVALGLIGVLWQNVTRRTREIGLRRATGATGRQVAVQVVMEVWIVTALAVIVGGSVALQAPVYVPGGLLTVADALSGAAVAALALFALTGLCAAYPGWLAARVDPSEALRYE
jgi:putative ABC transport system permease protein